MSNVVGIIISKFQVVIFGSCCFCVKPTYRSTLQNITANEEEDGDDYAIHLPPNSISQPCFTADFAVGSKKGKERKIIGETLFHEL